MNHESLIVRCVSVCAITATAAAGDPVFEEGFEPYVTTVPLPTISTWEPWEGDLAGAGNFFATTDQAHAGRKSVAIDGVDNAVHQFDDLELESGVWALEAWQFVPVSMGDSQYFMLLNEYEPGSITQNWSAQVEICGGDGVVRDTGSSGSELPLVRGEWVLLRNLIDLDADSQTFSYNGEFLYSASWTGYISGAGSLRIDTVRLWGNGSTAAVYYDDVLIREFEIGCVADIEPPGGDGLVGLADLQRVLAEWGECPPGGPCVGDIEPLGGDGVVSLPDLLRVLVQWGPCQ